MKRYAWTMALLVLTVVLAAAYPMSAQGCGGQMDHSTMGTGHMGGSGQMGTGAMGTGHMGGYGQTAPGYANPYATAPGQPPGTPAPAPSGQAPGNSGPSGHDHNH